MRAQVEKSRSIYSALNLPECSPVDEVKRAYREMALLHHPDKNMDDPSAADRFKRIAEAYQVLSNTEQKSKHDALLRGAGFGGGIPLNSTYSSASSLSSMSPRTPRRRTTSAGPSVRHPNTAHSPNASSYSTDQQEYFKQREKEREREALRKMERDKEAQRQKDQERARRLAAEKHKEEQRKQREQERLKEKMDKVCEMVRQRNASKAAGGTTEEDDFIQREKEKLRLQQERLKAQQETTNNERKVREMRAKAERQKESAERHATQEAMQVLVRMENLEAQDRKHCVVIEEQHERAMMHQAKVCWEREYYFNSQRQDFHALENTHRQTLLMSFMISCVQLQSQKIEDQKRSLILREERFTREQFVSVALRHRRQTAQIAEQRRAMEYDTDRARGVVSRLEGKIRGQLRVFHEEGVRRLQLDRAQVAASNTHFGHLMRALQCCVVEEGLVADRGVVVRAEADEWAQMVLGWESLRGALHIAAGEAVAYRRLSSLHSQVIRSLHRVQHELMEKTVYELRTERDDHKATAESLRSEATTLRGVLSAERENFRYELDTVKAELAQARAQIGTPTQSSGFTYMTRSSAYEAPETVCCAVQTDAAPYLRRSPSPTQAEEELAYLRRRVAELEKARSDDSSKDLVTLLCTENKRLLESNARLIDENWRLNHRLGTMSASPSPSRNSPLVAPGAGSSREYVTDAGREYRGSIGTP